MGQVWQLSVVACRGPLIARPRARDRARSLPTPASASLKATGGVAHSLTAPSPATPLQITRESSQGQCVRGCGKRKRFHVLYYQTSETGWVPETKLKEFKLNLEVPPPAPAFSFLFGLFFGLHRAQSATRHCQSQPSTVSRSPHVRAGANSWPRDRT